LCWNVTGYLVGGIAGYIPFGGNKFSDSYSSCILNAGSSGGGLSGGNIWVGEDEIDNFYWLNVTDKASNCYSSGNVGCTAVNSESYFFNYSKSPYTSWDFVNVWNNSNDGSYYPTLLGLPAYENILIIFLIFNLFLQLQKMVLVLLILLLQLIQQFPKKI
jgi:hypothetical protein